MVKCCDNFTMQLAANYIIIPLEIHSTGAAFKSKLCPPHSVSVVKCNSRRCVSFHSNILEL